MKLWIEASDWQSKKAIVRLTPLDFANISGIAVIKHAAFGDMLLLRPFLI